MKTAIASLIFICVLPNAAFGQQNKPIELGGYVSKLLGDRPIDETVVYAEAVNGAFKETVNFAAFPGFVSWEDMDNRQTGTVPTPAGYSIFLTGTKFKKLGPPYRGVIQFLGLAASKDGKDTILLIFDPRNPANMQVNGYDFKATCHEGTGSQCVQTFSKITGEGIYVLGQYLNATHDGGKTWFTDSAGLNSNQMYFINDVAMDTGLTHLYAATIKGLYKQDTLTDVWAPVNSYPNNGNTDARVVFIDKQNRIIVYDNSAPGTNNCNLSTDGGLSWQADTTGVSIGGTAGITGFAGDVYSNLYALKVTSTGVNKSIYNIYVSKGGTGLWEDADSGLYKIMGGYPFSIYNIQGDSIVMANTSAGTFVSADEGKTWAPHNNAIPTRSFSGFLKTATGRYIAGNILGLNYTERGESTWHKIYPANGYLNNPPLFQDSLGNIYTLDNYVNPSQDVYAIMKSSDNGNTWAADTAGLGNVSGFGLADRFFVDEQGGQHFWQGPWLVARPYGGDWAFDTAGLGMYPSVKSIGTDGKGYLYATGYLNGGTIMRRPVAGGTWVLDTAGIPSSIPYFPKVSYGSKDVFVFTTTNATGQLFQRMAGGWQAIPFPNNTTGHSLHVAAVTKDAAGYIYAAFYADYYAYYLDYGIFYTKDTGKTWVFAGLDSLTTTFKYSIGIKALVSYGDTTYAVTDGSGIYMLTHGKALPVTLSAVKAYPLGKGIQIAWSGYNETNMAGYDVEKSANGRQFIKIGSVAAKSLAGENDYGLFDAAPFSGDNFYRIKAVSKDGSAQYSGTVKVNIASSKTGIEVFPNPATGNTINVQLNNLKAGSYMLTIYNVAGQRLYAGNIKHPGGNAALAVPTPGMAKGILLVSLSNTGQSYSKTVAVP